MYTYTHVQHAAHKCKSGCRKKLLNYIHVHTNGTLNNKKYDTCLLNNNKKTQFYK